MTQFIYTDTIANRIMKKLFPLAALLMASNTLRAQIQVETTNSREVSKREYNTLTEKIKGSDTIMIFCFIDARYPSLGEHECGWIPNDELKDFADALVELTDNKYKAYEARVTIGNWVIGKANSGVTVEYKRGAYTRYRDSNCRKVRNDIYNYLGLPTQE